MSLLFDLFAMIGVLSLVVIFWYGMIESQEDIPGVNEPGYRRKGERK